MHSGRPGLSRLGAQSRGCYARHLSGQVRIGSLEGVLKGPTSRCLSWQLLQNIAQCPAQ